MIPLLYELFQKIDGMKTIQLFCSNYYYITLKLNQIRKRKDSFI